MLYFNNKDYETAAKYFKEAAEYEDISAYNNLVEKTWHKVNQHEGLRFAADLPHGYRNLSDNSVLFHDMIHYK
jgi:hypothetical protein